MTEQQQATNANTEQEQTQAQPEQETQATAQTNPEEAAPEEQSLQAELEQQQQKIEQLQQALNEAQKLANEAALRARAEVENIRRRVEQDVEKAHKFALEKFSGELLPVIDNLERALEATVQNHPDNQATIEGLELTLKSFLDTVKKFGIEQVNPEKQPLNPELHQAISVVESPDHQSGHVINAIQKGYTLNGRLLRPAMVIVAK